MLLLVLVVEVLCVVGVGDGDGAATPTVGISPAKPETDRTHVRITAIPNRFIGVLSCFENYQITGIPRYQKTGISK